MSPAHESATSSATLPPHSTSPLPHNDSAKSGLQVRSLFAGMLFLLSILALGIAVYRRAELPLPEKVVESFLQALLKGESRTAARYLSEGEKSDLGKVRPLQMELQTDSAMQSAFTLQVKTQKVTTSRAIVDATISRGGDSLPLQFLLEPSSTTGWKIRDIQNPQPPAERRKLEPESPEQRELREQLIDGLSRGGKTPVETGDP